MHRIHGPVYHHDLEADFITGLILPSFFLLATYALFTKIVVT